MRQIPGFWRCSPALHAISANPHHEHWTSMAGSDTLRPVVLMLPGVWRDTERVDVSAAAACGPGKRSLKTC